MTRQAQRTRLLKAAMGEPYFGAAADMVFNDMHLGLIEKHQRQMEEGFARIDALLAEQMEVRS